MTWIKIIDTEKELKLCDFTLSSNFKHVANVIRTPPEARRNTVITFNPIVPKNEWNDGGQWIYIFTIDGFVVKIGGTRTGLKDRTGSYLCGHHTIDRGGSGKCSVTNAYIYNTFDHYVERGCDIQMHGFKIPQSTIMIPVWGKDTEVVPQVYTAYETGALEAYKNAIGHYPALSDNSDPTQRE
jgi:hypothetical protein